MICRIGKIGGTHVYFKTCWEDIITTAMADPFCDRLGSEDDSTDLCGCQRNPWVYIHFVDYRTAYCYHDWVQVAFLFVLSAILYLILFAGVLVDTVLDMTRECIIDFILS